ncbi:uncharacterized protein EV154DRAFT_164193 [Mucor mucedo]|uniref:uncharacterized protein n=1 Tax=Mucor mucedo TaxID=29922 RepID=UPI0022201CB4|nr:uncharacterized protein EV154DRAFT_164193 [Mucor mucedo]KAI7893030.1 hypothetical protein EV154DRAFT_164193 [Mucor mucedo]
MLLYERQIRRQKAEYDTLNMKYMSGLDRVAEIQQQREMADIELEELSARLFEEANIMVASEKREKHQLKELLMTTEDQLIMEQSQLYELRARIESTTALCSPPPPYFDNVKKPMAQTMRLYNDHKNSLLPKTDNAGLLFDEIRTQQNLLLGEHRNDVIPDQCFVNHDGVLQLDYFQKFFEQQKRRNSSVPSLISDYSIEEEEEVYSSFFQLYPQVPQSEYLERCEIEDIEPCLQFGNSNSRMHVKVMMEHLRRAPCFIESITMEEAKELPTLCNAVTTVYHRPIWERLTATSPQPLHHLECSACGKKRNVMTKSSYYRFRLLENEDWLLIDQNCRDRLVAVCNFYSFIRNIEMGYYKQLLLTDLYLENVELRLKIFYSRMGNI